MIPNPGKEQRVQSGMGRLDYILCGGFLRGRTYSVVGPPGSGKTIFANQICFAHCNTRGNRCIYVTLLSENQTKLFEHLSSLSFFRPAFMPERLRYVGGYQTLRDGGLSALLALIRATVRQQRASMLAIDGVELLQRWSTDPGPYREFIHELQGTVGVLSCTTLLMSSGDRGMTAESSLVDGCFSLSDELVGPRAIRELTIHKFRGSDYLRGRHEVEISADGMVIHPRTEVQFASPAGHAKEDRLRMGFGLPHLDKMLNGGLLSGSCAAILGSPGTGKTTLGLSFLIEGAKLGQRGTYFGFYEPPPRLIDKVERLGLRLGDYIRAGLIDIVWQPPLEHMLDSLAEQLLEPFREVHEPRRRAFIDGLEGFRAASVHPRMGLFLSALTHQLRSLDVTTLISDEMELFSPRVAMPTPELANVVETVVMLRYIEVAARVERVLSIMKMRESSYDSSIRELKIDAKGLALGPAKRSLKNLLAGQPRANATPARAERNRT